jgi:hypothetical protein
MTQTTAAPIYLQLAHTPIASEKALSQLAAAELAEQLQDGRYIPIPSGEDVLAILAHATRYDLQMIETTLRGGTYEEHAHPLEGTTVIIEANNLATHTIEILQNMSGKDRHDVIAELIKIGREKKRQYVSRRMVMQALQGNVLAQEPEPVLEAASLLLPLLQMAQTAVSRHHSLILRYTQPPDDIHFNRQSVLRAQLRPLMAAVLFAIAFVAFNLLTTHINNDNIRPVLISNLLSLLLLPFGFLLPVWVAQTAVWLYARSNQIKVKIISAREAEMVVEKQRLRPFILTPTARPFTLMAFYLPPPHKIRALPNPAFIYFLCFGLGILPLIGIITLGDSFLPLTHLFMASWVSALFFGLVHHRAERMNG